MQILLQLLYINIGYCCSILFYFPTLSSLYNKIYHEQIHTVVWMRNVPKSTCIQKVGPWLVVLLGKIIEPLGGGALWRKYITLGGACPTSSSHSLLSVYVWRHNLLASCPGSLLPYLPCRYGCSLCSCKPKQTLSSTRSFWAWYLGIATEEQLLYYIKERRPLLDIFGSPTDQRDQLS